MGLVWRIDCMNAQLVTRGRTLGPFFEKHVFCTREACPQARRPIIKDQSNARDGATPLEASAGASLHWWSIGDHRTRERNAYVAKRTTVQVMRRTYEARKDG